MPKKSRSTIDHLATGLRRQAARQQDTARRERESDRPAQPRRAGERSQSTSQLDGQQPGYRVEDLGRTGNQKRRQPEDDRRQGDIGEPTSGGDDSLSGLRPPGASQVCQNQNQRVFHQPVENQRCHERIEDTAQNTSQRDRQVKCRRVLGPGPRGREPSVASQGTSKKGEQVQRQPEDLLEPRAQHHDQRNDQKRQ